MTKITPTPLKVSRTNLAAYRQDKLLEQGGRCALTHHTIPPGKAVLDHCHKTGRIRGVLGRGANSLLGVIENNWRRFGLTLPVLFALCRNVESYLSRDYSSNPTHPTFYSVDERRLRNNAKRRKKKP